MARRGRRPHPDILTPREWEVLALLRERLTNEQIAERLGITLDGAKYHVSEILSKVGVATREDAAAWRPVERRAWWQRLIAPPVLARIAGGLTIGAAVCALVALAIGVIVTNGGSKPPVGQPVTRLSTTSAADDCPPPPFSCGQIPPVWETTGEYRDEHSDVVLHVLWFAVSGEQMTVTYALINANLRSVWPRDAQILDDLGNEYKVTSNSLLCPPTGGVVTGIATARRPPEAGETLTLVIDDVTIDDGVNLVPVDSRWQVPFIQNVRRTNDEYVGGNLVHGVDTLMVGMNTTAIEVSRGGQDFVPCPDR